MRFWVADAKRLSSWCIELAVDIIKGRDVCSMKAFRLRVEKVLNLVKHNKEHNTRHTVACINRSPPGT